MKTNVSYFLKNKKNKGGEQAYCWNILKRKESSTKSHKKNPPATAHLKSSGVECIKLLGSFVLRLQEHILHSEGQG